MNYMSPQWMRIVRILEDQGGLFTFEDILDGVRNGQYQIWEEGESVVVTAVRLFPRKKVLEVILAVGTLTEVYGIQPRVVAFAREQGCDMLLAAVGRDGWDAFKTPGWGKVSSTYIRRV